MNATQNLALYCASAILEALPAGDYAPPLPNNNEQPGNNKLTLAATVEPWRKLTYINMWQLDKFDEATQHAFSNTMNVPTWDLRVPEFDPITRSIATMAAGRQFVTPPNYLPFPEGVQGIREWVYNLPLRTAERVMALVNRNSDSWCLDTNQASQQFPHLYASCAWGPRLDRAIPGSALTSRRIMPNLLFVVQSPWLLSPGDFRMFCERSMYRHYATKDPKTGKVKATELDYVDRLWATIYDDCVKGGTHYFVLTTYNEWAFGAFSRGWTTAWITPPKPYNTGSPTIPGPTILQSILFWMHSAQHFYFDSYGLARTPSFAEEESGLPTPITPTSRHSHPPSLTPAESESELDLASDTDDNTLDKGWLDEMRTSVREIKDLKGAKKLERERSGSWVIPEIWEDMEPPKIPPKRTVCVVEADDNSLETEPDGWYHKRQRTINDDYVTNRRTPPPPRPARTPHAPTNSTSPPDISSTKVNPSPASAVTEKAQLLPGGFPSISDSGSTWSPWFSEGSPVKIFWSRTFTSVRSTFADAFHRILRSREQGHQGSPVPPTAPAFTLIPPPPPPRRPVEKTIRVPLNQLRAFDLSGSFGEVQIHDENERPPGPIILAPPPLIQMHLPQTTVAIGGHTIELTRPRLMSGIHLDQTIDQSWPPPRQPFTPLLVQDDSDSDVTEIDPDAQRRPECGFRDYSPSVHANSIYEM
ncbi:unnamed protein product [Rhizoctonia solani]|uniref:Uncharacterized protein n=1 Tax=Rhizoctonia solani TaxID=456999 RepID=A0A8H2WR50_9AGAM|nr:unnamed protein product [Rhizoctonia solani]CAE6434258.1 unnamed protein product [Rhizoctonia solani]